MAILESKQASSIITKLYLGGTFNPVHLGHAQLLMECQSLLQADKAFFVPSANPPHKSIPQVSSLHRIALLQLVADELNSSNKNACVFDVETCELNRDGFSYTIDTLQLLRQQSPNDRIVWVVGMDSLVNLSTWRCWRELLEWSNLLVVTRPGWSLPASGLVFEWMHNKIVPPKMLAVAGGISIVETTPMAISSRAIREQFGLGQEPKNLLSESVLTYIAQHQLY